MVIVHIVSGVHGENSIRTEHGKFFDDGPAQAHATRLRAARGWREVSVDARLEKDSEQHESHAGLGLVPPLKDDAAHVTIDAVLAGAIAKIDREYPAIADAKPVPVAATLNPHPLDELTAPALSEDERPTKEP